MLLTSVTLGRHVYTSSWQHLTSYVGSSALTPVSAWAGLVPRAVDAVLPNSASYVSQPSRISLAYACLSRLRFYLFLLLPFPNVNFNFRPNTY